MSEWESHRERNEILIKEDHNLKLFNRKLDSYTRLIFRFYK